MYECFHCGEKAVIRDSDCDLEEVYPDAGKGIVHFCHCTKCGAEIEYIVKEKEDE